MNYGKWKNWRRQADVIAKQLGVTPVGLQYLARAVATGKLPGGIGFYKLVAQGYAVEAVGRPGGDITPAGREIVRQARELGW